MVTIQRAPRRGHEPVLRACFGTKSKSGMRSEPGTLRRIRPLARRGYGGFGVILFMREQQRLKTEFGIYKTEFG